MRENTEKPPFSGGFSYIWKQQENHKLMEIFSPVIYNGLYLEKGGWNHASIQTENTGIYQYTAEGDRDDCYGH